MATRSSASKEVAEGNCIICGEAAGEEMMTACDLCKLQTHNLCAGVAEDTCWFCPKCVQSLQAPKPKKTGKGSKSKSDAGATPGTAELPKEVWGQLEMERIAKENELAQQVLIRAKRLEMEKAHNVRLLQMEKEMQEREFAAANEMRERKLRQEQELLERQLAAEKEFSEKQKLIRKQLKESKLKMEKKKKKKTDGGVKSELDPAGGQSSKNQFETPTGVPGLGQGKKKQKPQPDPKKKEEEKSEESSSEEGEDDDESSEEESSSDSDGLEEETPSKKKDGPGQLAGKLTREQLAARQGMAKHLPTFKGEPEVWPLFISSFEYTTAACGFTNIENLKRLQDCLKGDALEAVRSRLVLPDAVPDVIKDLRNLFGKPEKLLRALLVKVRSAQAPRTDRLETFIHFGITVKQLCDHLEAASLKDHLSNPMLVQELVEKMPTEYQLDWVRFKRGKVGTPLRMFTDFLTDVVADVSEVSEFAGLSLRETTRSSGGGKGKRNEFVHLHETAPKNPAPSGKPSSACWFCKRTEHLMRNCGRFRDLRVPDRMKAVDRLGLCVICLNKHGDNRCNSKMR